MMEQENPPSGGSATRWGPLFGARPRNWAETWEGPTGWGTPVYEHVLGRVKIGPGTQVLDCGCGAGRFVRMAADRGAAVAGVDAAAALVEIAAERTPEGDFQVGDLEALPWPDDAFDVVIGFASFQFADDKARALAEARRVSRRHVVVVIPTRVPESGLAQMFRSLIPLFPAESLDSMKQSGIFALSEPGKLEEVLAASGLSACEDDEIDCQVTFTDADTAVLAFVGAGPTALAVRHSGEEAVAEGVRSALGAFTDPEGRVKLPAWYRAVIAEARA